MSSNPHISVLLDEIIAAFKPCQLRSFFEGTLGAGGHAKALLGDHPEIQTYIGCDQDENALLIAQEKLQSYKGIVRFEKSNFSSLDTLLKKHHLETVDGFFLTSGFPRCNSIHQKEASALITKDL